MSQQTLAPGVTAEVVSAAAPVELIGQIDGAMWFYFRAEGNYWEFSVADSREGAVQVDQLEQGMNPYRPLYVHGYYGVNEDDADYMHQEQAAALILLCADVWRQSSDVRLQDEDSDPE